MRVRRKLFCIWRKGICENSLVTEREKGNQHERMLLYTIRFFFVVPRFSLSLFHSFLFLWRTERAPRLPCCGVTPCRVGNPYPLTNRLVRFPPSETVENLLVRSLRSAAHVSSPPTGNRTLFSLPLKRQPHKTRRKGEGK
eukprot:gene9762-6846_t